MTDATHCGFVAIVGRPNVGKSTLLNRLLGQKLSITSRKPQTTRHRILGVLTVAGTQTIYVDTPGVQSTHKGPMHRYMNRSAIGAIDDVDLVIFVIQGSQWTEADARVAAHVVAANRCGGIFDFLHSAGAGPGAVF